MYLKTKYLLTTSCSWSALATKAKPIATTMAKVNTETKDNSKEVDYKHGNYEYT